MMVVTESDNASQDVVCPALVEVAADDSPELRAMLGRCSQRTVRWRFLGEGAAVTERFVQHALSSRSLVTLAAWVNGVMVGVGSVEAGERHELAVLVEDQWQRRGVGRLLAATLAREAARHGVAELYAELAVTNVPALRLVLSLWPGAWLDVPEAGVRACVVPTEGAVVMQAASRYAPPASG